MENSEASTNMLNMFHTPMNNESQSNELNEDEKHIEVSYKVQIKGKYKTVENSQTPQNEKRD